MVYILNSSHKVIFFGPRTAPRAVRYWAEHGMIHYEDSRTNVYRCMSVREFAGRLKAVNDLLENKSRTKNKGFWDWQYVDLQAKFVQDGVELCRLAQQQRAKMDEEKPKLIY